jgi:hypothetical protein
VICINGKRDSIFNLFTVPLAPGIVAMWQVKIAGRSLRLNSSYYYKINLRTNSPLFSVIITYMYRSVVVQNIETGRRLLSLFFSFTLKMFVIDAFVKLKICLIFCSFHVSTSTTSSDIYCNNIVFG